MTRFREPRGIPEESIGVESPHLLERELARRWRLSTRTLQRWRQAGVGPVFLQIGRRITYRLCDVESFEGAREGRGAGTETKP